MMIFRWRLVAQRRLLLLLYKEFCDANIPIHYYKVKSMQMQEGIQSINYITTAKKETIIFLELSEKKYCTHMAVIIQFIFFLLNLYDVTGFVAL